MNEIKTSNGSVYDEYPGLKTFVDHMVQRHPEYGGCVNKNLYVIQSIDRNGNITDEKYGVNLVTDIGTDNTVYMMDSESYMKYKFMMLEGVASADVSTVMDYKMPEHTRDITAGPANIASFATQYPMSYDSDTGVISQIRRMWKVTFDYNYTGITTDMTVNCILYTESSNQSGAQNTPFIKITTYDANGLPNPIIKHVDEKIVMTVFASGSFNESVLNDAYDAGQYVLMNPIYILAPHYVIPGVNIYRGSALSGSYGMNVTSQDYNETWRNMSTSTSFGLTMNNSEHYNYYWSNPNIMLLDPRVYASKTLCTVGESSYDATYANQYVYIMNEEKLSTPESITCDTVLTDNLDSNLLSKTFGFERFNVSNCNGMIPAVDFSISSLKSYNYTTHDWDIDVPFVNEPTAYYDNPFVAMFINIGVAGAGWNNCVYMNPRAKGSTGRPAVGVTAFTGLSGGSLSRPMYATDKYWDRSSWELISNVSAIPASLQNKKYYISTGGTNSHLKPTYNQTYHRLNVGTTHTVLNVPTDFIKKGSYCIRPIFDQTNGWILGSEHLMFMNGNDVQYSYKLSGPEYMAINNSYNYSAPAGWEDNYDKYYLYQNSEYVLNTNPTYNRNNVYYTTRIDPIARYGFGNKILVATIPSDGSKIYPEKVRLYTITSSSVAPTYEDITIDTDTTNRAYPGMYSVSSNGYFVIQDTQSHCANILDISTGTITKLTNVDLCYAIEYTNYCIYRVTGSSPITFNVYDMSTNTVYASFVLDDAYSNITYICGWNNRFYIKSTSGSASYYNMYNISDGSLTNITAGFTIPNYFLTSSDSGLHETNGFLVNQLGMQMFDQDMIVIPPIYSQYINRADSYAYYAIRSSSPLTTFELFKHGPLNERPIDNYYEQNTYSVTYGQHVVPSLTRAIQSVGQSKLLLIDSDCVRYSGSLVMQSMTDYNAIVTDIGPIVDSGSPGNMAPSHFTTSDTTSWHGGLVYWNNGIIRITDDGMTWYPLEFFIQMKMTGTTYTIQSYNNPKKINSKSFTLFKTNRGPNLQHSDPIRSTGDLNMVFQHDAFGYYYSYRHGYSWAKILVGSVFGPYQVQQAVLAGTTFRIEVEPETGFEFLDGTFKWWLVSVRLDYPSSPYWYTNLANADTKGNTDGGSITTSYDTECIGVLITSSSADTTVLTPTMIKGIKITMNPQT